MLLFVYVFGGAIAPPGAVDYKEFLIAGIFAQTVVFGATFTGAGLAGSRAPPVDSPRCPGEGRADRAHP